jgi:hypothetical protein
VDTLIQLLQKRRWNLNSLMPDFTEDKLQWRGEILVPPLDFETENGQGHVATALGSLSMAEIVLERAEKGQSGAGHSPSREGGMPSIP